MTDQEYLTLAEAALTAIERSWTTPTPISNSSAAAMF